MTAQTGNRPTRSPTAPDAPRPPARLQHRCQACDRPEDPAGAFRVCWSGCGHVFATPAQLERDDAAYWPMSEPLAAEEITDCPLCCTPFPGGRP